METILRNDAMQLINSGHPFDMEFVTCDRRRGTGGDLIAVKKWMKLRDDMPDDQVPGVYAKKYVRKRESSNFKNKTFRIFNPANRAAHPITVHYRLFISFNGKTVING